MLHNLFLQNISVFNDLVIKGNPLKSKIFICFYGGCLTALQLFTAKFSVDSKFNILANFNLVLTNSYMSLFWHQQTDTVIFIVLSRTMHYTCERLFSQSNAVLLIK